MRYNPWGFKFKFVPLDWAVRSPTPCCVQEVELARLKKRLASVTRDPSFRRIGELNAVLISASTRLSTGRRDSDTDASLSTVMPAGMWAQGSGLKTRGALSPRKSALVAADVGAQPVSSQLPPLE